MEHIFLQGSGKGLKDPPPHAPPPPMRAVGVGRIEATDQEWQPDSSAGGISSDAHLFDSEGQASGSDSDDKHETKVAGR